MKPTRHVLAALLPALVLTACPPADSGAKTDKTGEETKSGEGSDGQGGETGVDPWAGLPDWKRELMPEDDSWKSVEQVYIFNNGAEPETLDPHLKTGVPEGRIGLAIFEGLVNSHPETLGPVPGVAESWDISEDGLTYTFHLRADAKWSDGSALTAQDFYDSWRRGILPATASQYAYMFYPIAGAEDFNKGVTDDFSTVGLKVVDEHTFEVKLREPCPYFLDLVAFDTLFPVPMAVVDEHQDKWTRPENIVSNGPFMMTEWAANQRIVMVKSEHYWDRDNVLLEQVIALPIVDQETAYKTYLQGDCHWLTDVPLPKIDECMRRPDYYVMPYLGSYFYRFNTREAPFDDVRVRKALSLSLDRRVITNEILRAGQIPATWFTPKMHGYEPPAGLAENREEARRLLADAGFPGGEGFPEVALLFNTQESHRQVAEVLVQQWEENLGIVVQLRNTEWKVYLDNVTEGNYQIARAGWIGDYNDPNTFLDMWVTDGGNNNTGWSNERYDELIRMAASESDAAKRMEIFREAETLLIEEHLPILPVYIYVNKGLLSPEVAGWYENVRDKHPFNQIYMLPSE
jgi:oligopeptide transport system substrate-binding protein